MFSGAITKSSGEEREADKYSRFHRWFRKIPFQLLVNSFSFALHAVDNSEPQNLHAE
jgi:hypothetical protein